MIAGLDQITEVIHYIRGGGQAITILRAEDKPVPDAVPFESHFRIPIWS